MSNALMPDIRFKGFADDWEQRKLGEISDSYSGGTPTVGVKEYYEGQIPFIRSAEINSEITELFLTEDGLKNSSARLVDLGDILYALYGATSGEVGRARIKGAINQAILAIKPHSGYDSEYLSQWLRKSKQSIIETYLQGGQGNLSGAIVKELLVDFPTFEEQQAIGAYFKQFDNLITLHQKELEKLIDIKKSMLINMFPQGDEKVPRIRFKGFFGDWNYPVLGTLGKTYTGLSGKTKEDFGNGYATYITYMNVFTNPITNPSQVDSIESDAMQNEVQEGDIFFTTSSETPEEVGMSSVLLAKSGTTYLNSFCFGYRLNENVKIDKYYLAYLLRSPVVREKIVFLAQGISRFNISKTKMMEIAIPVSEKTEEQGKIGAFFFNLDKLIEAQEKKIAQLKNIKSALLNKMFPKGDE